MNELPLPEGVRSLIETALVSMDHVEVLFRVSRGDGVTAEWLAQDAHIEPTVLAKVLRDLEHSRLVAREGTSYRVSQNPEQRATVEEFAATYNARPVTVIRAVYARPSPLSSFAEAFRLRRED